MVLHQLYSVLVEVPDGSLTTMAYLVLACKTQPAPRSKSYHVAGLQVEIKELAAILPDARSIPVGRPPDVALMLTTTLPVVLPRRRRGSLTLVTVCDTSGVKVCPFQ